MLYVMLYNAYPFEREEDTANNRTDALKMMRRILNMELEIPKHPRVSQEAIDLMLRILVKNPNDRLTIQEIQVRICPSFAESPHIMTSSHSIPSCTILVYVRLTSFCRNCPTAALVLCWADGMG